MRHLWSLLAGLVAAPLAWLLLSTGQFRSVTTVAGWDEAGRFDTADLVAPAAFLAGAGVLLGLLGTLRWSPVGPLVAGLLYVIPTVLMFIDPFDTLDRFLRTDDDAPRRLLGQDLEPWLPVENGTLLVLGALLLMAVLSGQRWRPWPSAAAPAPAAVAGTPAEDEEEREKEKDATHTAHATAATMTDDEILAAAAALDEQAADEQKPAGQKPDRQDATGPDAAEPSTGPGRTATAEETADRDR